jgi:hypothetical protein
MSAEEPARWTRLVILRYLNRLSDLLFTLARLENRRAGGPWRGRRKEELRGTDPGWEGDGGEEAAGAGGAMILRRWSRVRPDGALLRADVRLPEGRAAPGGGGPRPRVQGVQGLGLLPLARRAPWWRGVRVGGPVNFSLNGIGADPEDFTELEAFARNTLSREVEELLLVLEALADGGSSSRSPGAGGAPRALPGGWWCGPGGGGGPSGRVDALVTWGAVADFDRWSDELKEEWRAEGRIHVLNGRTGQQMPLDVPSSKTSRRTARRWTWPGGRPGGGTPGSSCMGPTTPPFR